MSNKSGKQKWYAIAEGIGAPCILDSWDEASKRVIGVTGSRHMSFYDKEEAKEWLKNPLYPSERSKLKKKGKSKMNRISAAEPISMIKPDLPTVYMYTDGACTGNPGPGGYACILVYGEHEKVLSGGEPDTTNNRMELWGVLRGLMALKRDCNLIIVSDSKYVVDAINKGWVKSWKQHGWHLSDGKEAKNTDLWDGILCLLEGHNYKFEWVKGHTGHYYNERCDSIATTEADKIARGDLSNYITEF